MTIETALPVATPVVEAGEQQADPSEFDRSQEGAEEPKAEEKTEEPAKKEKTPEQREIERLRRAIDRKTRQLYEARAADRREPDQRPVTHEARSDTNTQPQAADEPLTLSRAELDKLVREQAEKLAPSLQQQRAEIEHRKGIVEGLAKEWGKEKFDAYANDLDEALDGLSVGNKPKPVVDAIFESEKPGALIEYLSDPDNADEAEQLSRMNDRQAGRAIAKLEAKLSAQKPKPQRSNAPTPIESIKGAGATSSGMPDPSNTKAYIRWANEQDRRR